MNVGVGKRYNLAISERSTALAVGVVACFFATIVSLNLWVPIRILAGVPLSLFLPGYLGTLAFFPANSQFDGRVRFVLAVAMSIATVLFVGLVLGLTTGIVTATSAGFSLLLLSLVSGVAAYVRADRQRRVKLLELGVPRWIRWGTILPLLFGGALLIGLATAVFYTNQPRSRLTELRVEERASETVVVVANREGQTMEYRYIALIEGVEVESGHLQIASDRTAEIVFPLAGRARRGEVNLFLSGQSDPYRSVTFVTD